MIRFIDHYRSQHWTGGRLILPGTETDEFTEEQEDFIIGQRKAVRVEVESEAKTEPELKPKPEPKPRPEPKPKLEPEPEPSPPKPTPPKARKPRQTKRKPRS